MTEEKPKIVIDEPEGSDADSSPHESQAPSKSDTQTRRRRARSPTSKSAIASASLNYRLGRQFARFDFLQDFRKEVEQLKQNPALELKDVGGKGTVLESTWSLFSEEHEKLASNCTPEFLQSDYVKDDVYDKAFRSYAGAKDVVTALEQLTLSTLHSHSDAPSSTHLKLPEIKLPTFDGGYADWLLFRDLFTSMVINQQQLSPIERMQYLKTSLTGSAAQLIANIPVAGEQFEAAWGTITQRYENTRLLITAQLDRLFSLQLTSAKSASQLNTLLNAVTEALNTLRALGSPVEHWDHLLVHLLTLKLDSNTREAWEVKLGSSTSMPTLEQLITFLTGRARARERLEVSTQPSQPPTATQHSSSSTGGRRVPAAHAAMVAAPKPKYKVQYPCDKCGSKHYLSQCDQFKKMSQQERATFSRMKGLCPNCLGHHPVEECKNSYRCWVCRGLHHTLLHYEPEPSSATSKPQ